MKTSRSAEAKTQPSSDEKVAVINAKTGIRTTVITGCFSIATLAIGIVGTLVTTKPEASFQRISSERAQALKAEWRGTIYQPEGPGPNKEPVNGASTFWFDPKATIVDGTWEIETDLWDGRHVKIRYRIHGGFLDNRYLRLQYETTEGSAYQFGSLLLDLHGDGTHLHGSYLGYGAYSDRIVTGTVAAIREKK